MAPVPPFDLTLSQGLWPSYSGSSKEWASVSYVRATFLRPLQMPVDQPEEKSTTD
jgi:hypothetical protein